MTTDRVRVPSVHVSAVSPSLTNIAASTTATSAREGIAVELAAPRFLCAWAVVVALHLVSASFLTALAWVYWFVTRDEFEQLAKLAAGERFRYLHHACAAFGLVGALHWWQLLRIAFVSFQARELVLPDDSSSVSSVALETSGRLSRSTRVSSVLKYAPLEPLALPLRLVAQFWEFLFSAHHGVLGVESDWFPFVFAAREIAEIVSQSLQAHRRSDLLPSSWLDSLCVALVVANCWSTPAVHYALRRRQGSERVVSMLFDVLLNLGSSVAIPLAVFLPYYAVFDAESMLPLELMYDPVWLSRIVTENQLLFSVSTPDIFSKLVPHIGIYISLTSVVVLIKREIRGGSSLTKQTPSTTATRRPSAVFPLIKSASLRTASRLLSSAVTAPAKERFVARVSQRQRNALHVLFGAWGLALLMLHVHAVTRSHTGAVPRGCREASSPWFTSGYSCVVYTYNCYREGTKSPSEASWATLDSSSLVYLGISHCPELRVPRRLQSYSNLLALHVHNCTIADWPAASAISAATHAKMIAVTMVWTNMSGIPDGLLEPLPASLTNLQLAHTNLTSLPSNFHERWRSMVSVFIEHSHIREFPDTLLQLEGLGSTELSLHGNLIESLPELTSSHQSVFSLTVSANPLRELPESVGDSSVAFGFFNAENTLLRDLPAWVRSRVAGVIFLHGTPYCDAHPDDQRDAQGGAYVTCSMRDTRGDGRMPVGFIEPHFPL